MLGTVSTWLQRVTPMVVSSREGQSLRPEIQVKSESFRSFLSVFVVGLALIVPVLWTIGLFTVRTVFILCFVWLLISSELFAPTTPTTWWRRLRWVKAGGWVVMAYIVFERIVAVVQ